MSVEDLTPRQRAIAGLMANGLKNVQIAQRLGISTTNVSVQKTLMKQRLGVATCDEVIAMVGPFEPDELPPEIDVSEDGYAVPSPRKRTLFFHTTRGPARTPA